jgi:hypothetical protein
MRKSKFSSLSCLLIALSVAAMAGPAISQQSLPPDASQPQNQGQPATQSTPEQKSERNDQQKRIF